MFFKNYIPELLLISSDYFIGCHKSFCFFSQEFYNPVFSNWVKFIKKKLFINFSKYIKSFKTINFFSKIEIFFLFTWVHWLLSNCLWSIFCFGNFSEIFPKFFCIGNFSEVFWISKTINQKSAFRFKNQLLPFTRINKHGIRSWIRFLPSTEIFTMFRCFFKKFGWETLNFDYAQIYFSAAHFLIFFNAHFKFIC